jgi:hypothetical protein
LVGAGVGPFAEHGLDEAFGLAVGLRAVDAGEALAEAERAQQVLEAMVAIAASVVGEKRLYRRCRSG